MGKPKALMDKVAEHVAWCDSGKEVDFRHKKFAQAIITEVIDTILELPELEIEPLDNDKEVMAHINIRNGSRNALRGELTHALNNLKESEDGA
jgi:hypothetical protein